MSWWRLLALTLLLSRWRHQGKTGVVACSALKHAYRSILAEGVDQHVLFIHLQVVFALTLLGEAVNPCISLHYP